MTRGELIEEEEQGKQRSAEDDRFGRLIDFEIPTFKLAYFGVLVASVYVVGFIVSGLHVARFGIPSQDLLKARYAASGALVLLNYLFPFFTGVVFWREFASIRTKDGPAYRKVLLPIFVTVAIGVGTWRGVFMMLYVPSDETAAFRWSLWWFILVAAVSAVATVFLRDQVLGDSKWRSSVRHVGRWAALVGLYAISLRIFAMKIYPSLDPGLGGGAATHAVLVPSTQPVARTLERYFNSPVLVVDRSNTMTRIVGDSSTQYRGVEIQNDLISAFMVLGAQPLASGAMFERAVEPADPVSSN